MLDVLGRRDVLELVFASSVWASYDEEEDEGTTTARGTSTRVKAQESEHADGGPTLTRLATTVSGAEFTGLFLTDDGRLFFNVQHPWPDNRTPYDEGTVGALVGANMYELPREFSSVQVPKNERQKNVVRTAVGQHQPLANGGDVTVDGTGLGIPYTKSGEPMTAGDNPDFNGFVPADRCAKTAKSAGKGNREGYLFTNWETQPGMVSRLHIRQRGKNGAWEVIEKMNVDFGGVEGTWNNCFGTVTPWQTPLTSEEYEPSAEAWFEPDQQTYGNAESAFEDYLGYFGNAYRYGYVVEIDDPTGEPSPEKRFAMGRFSHENAVVMPDRKTAYMSDDGTGTVFFKFVADRAGDLSAGTLYAAKANQDGGSDPNAVGFDIEWVELASASDDEVESWIAEYDGQNPEDDPQYITDEDVRIWAAGKADDDRVAFLESRKAAAAKGATDEFRKMEGVNVPSNAEPGDYMYMAMSELNETMLSNEATDEFDDSQDDIELKGNDYGAVYRMRLESGYDVSRMEPVLTGGPDANVCGGCPYDAAPNSKSTVCQSCAHNPKKDEDGDSGTGMAALKNGSLMDPENTIANPDNIVVMPDGRVVIGEDSGIHENNMLWVYDPGED
ncbi:PhoX family protein [Haladaptatus caseinilyticus]|uniref:PhoX family protein n=1 Tax=Haladaptatus caseinilyticus TaxID=2993314 RepID=UPI00224A5830|nr:alkaline phosphatase PhoX [Haladaptatus caseinilyticus]